MLGAALERLVHTDQLGRQSARAAYPKRHAPIVGESRRVAARRAARYVLLAKRRHSNGRGSMSLPADQPAERPLSAIVGDATREMSTLVRKEIELAKLELSREAGKAAAAGGLFGAAGVLVVISVFFLSAALGLGLWQLGMYGWAAALTVALLYLVIAAILAVVGKRAIKSFKPAPERTIKTIKEDVQWARNRKK